MKCKERANLEYAVAMLKRNALFKEVNYRAIRRSMLSEGLIVNDDMHGIGVVMEFFYDRQRTIKYIESGTLLTFEHEHKHEHNMGTST